MRAAEAAEIVCPLAVSPASLIPGVSDAFGTLLLGSKIYRGLMRWRPDGTLQPDLARAVDVSPDGLTYTFHLRPDVTWHDSGGFSAADVAFSINRFHRSLQPRLRLDRLKSVETPDELTAVLTLSASDDILLRKLDVLSLPIVPQHVHDKPGWALDPRLTLPVGTGPFRVESWADSKLRLVRFEWYAGPKPAIAVISCPVLPDAAARLVLAESPKPLLLAGEAIDLPAIPRLRSLSALAVEGDWSPAVPAMAGLRLNLVAKPLDHMEVRLGLACAIDREMVVRNGWSGLGRVATGPTVASSAGRNDDAVLPEHSLRAAAEHFSSGGLRPDDDGIRARLRFLLPPGAPWQGLFAAVQASLLQAAVELVAEPVAAAEWQARVAAGAYQITGFVADQTGDPALDLAVYEASLPELAPLLASGATCQAEALLVERMPAIWLVEPAIPVVRDKRLHMPDGVLGSFARASLA